MQENCSEPYGQIKSGLLAVKAGQIHWLGVEETAPDFSSAVIFDGNGGWLTPGLIDCHTHLVYAGNRAQEFEWRLQGLSYEHIAQQGGGINSTVVATRAASEEELLQSAGQRLKQLLREGVTCIEIKSGYGLNLETEVRMLRVARMLGRQFPVTIYTTFLGAHALPPEYKNRADDYIDHVCEEMLPTIAEQWLADAVDVFCEDIGFSIAQCRKIFASARKLDLPVKGHVEQLSYQGGARLLADCAGLSADHLEYLPASDIPYLKQSNIVAVLLPGAYYFLHERQLPPIAAMRTAGLPMAVATDLNPGSSPMASLLLAMNQACVLFGLTPEEALAGVTRFGAQALRLDNRKGQLQTGWDADLVLWTISHPAELSYGININTPTKIWVGGKLV
ncbi:MAG: imidazolonepropionase [Pseudomonadales bacterium]